MTELLSHLLDAPLANIFILAGLAFLGIAVIGKIHGKIEPSTTGRVMAGALGLALLAYGIYAHSVGDAARTSATQSATEKQSPEGPGQPNSKPEQPPPTKSLFAGHWKNDSPETRGITRLEIQQEGETVRVHAWATCSPQDCDWGIETGAVSAGSAIVAWDQPGVLRKMTLTADASRLKMTLDSVFKDQRPEQHGLKYFVKGE